MLYSSDSTCPRHNAPMMANRNTVFVIISYVSIKIRDQFLTSLPAQDYEICENIIWLYIYVSYVFRLLCVVTQGATSQQMNNRSILPCITFQLQHIKPLYHMIS